MELDFLDGEKTAVITMNNGENRLNLDFFKQLNNALDQIERNVNVQVVITTGKGRFYSNGIDLDLLAANPDQIPEFHKQMLSTIQRLLTFPILTIAAINGHAFAGGLMLALSHDLRVMRTGRGWLSLNEIYLRLRIEPSLLKLVKCKVPPGPVRHALFVLGKRFPAEEALSGGLIDRLTSLENLLAEAMELGRQMCKVEVFDRGILHQMKCDVYRHTLDVINSPFDVSTFLTSRGHKTIKSRI